MTKKLLIRDLTLRDGQQSQFATRMNQKQVDSVLDDFRRAGFYAMEVWGGAVPDSVMRYLGENPWTRLEKIKAGIGDVSKLTALSRGRNLFGYNPYPESVIEGFNRNAVRSGIGIMRIFDALNDLNNMKSTIKYVKENGGLADCCICYTVDSKLSSKERKVLAKKGVKVPDVIFSIDYFVEKARELEKMGADMISIKDMAGLVDPATAGKLIKALKEAVKIPIDMHTHCTPGYGLGAVLMSIVNGVDIVDAVVMPFAGGPAAPAYELVAIFAEKLGIEMGIDNAAVAEISRKLFEVRKELAEFDQYKMFPKLFDLTKDKLPADIDALFNDAITAAKSNDIDTVIEKTQAIEKYFNFPAPNETVRIAQIPGGMYTNMLAQLQQAGLGHLLERVLQVVPKVRIDAGSPPLVTPTSQIVGIQAVNCVVDEVAGKPHYSNTSVQFVNLVKGGYGHTPIPVAPEFRKQIAGVSEETPYDTSSYEKQENPLLDEFDDVKLATNEKEELLLELFPSVANGFLKALRKKEYEENFINTLIENQNKIDAANRALIDGLNENCYGPESQEII